MTAPAFKLPVEQRRRPTAQIIPIRRWQTPRLVRLEKTAAILHLLAELDDGQPLPASAIVCAFTAGG